MYESEQEQAATDSAARVAACQRIVDLERAQLHKVEQDRQQVTNLLTHATKEAEDLRVQCAQLQDQLASTTAELHAVEGEYEDLLAAEKDRGNTTAARLEQSEIS